MSLLNAVVLSLLFIQVQLATSQTNESDELIKRCPPNLLKSYTKAAEWGRCYEFHSEERTWFDASSVCQRYGGHLVTIREERIQDFLYKALVNYRWPRNGIWIGATDREREMDWKWVTGERVKDGYSKWARGQPSCGIFCMEDCALMKWKEAGRWHDYHCSLFEEYSFICEYAMGPKPTPTTTTTTTTTAEPETSSPTTILIAYPVTAAVTEKTYDPTSTTLSDLEEYRLNGEETDSNYSIIFGSNSAQSGHLLESHVSESNGSYSSQSSHLLNNPVSENNGLHHELKGVLSNNIVIEKEGFLVAVVISSVAVLLICLALFILFRRRQKRKQRETDEGIGYANPFYGEAKQPLNADTSGTEVEDIKGGEIKDFVLQDHSDNETLIIAPKRVMNVYDKPPSRVIAVQKVKDVSPANEEKSCPEENYYDEVRSNLGQVPQDYDTPRSLRDSEDEIFLENHYYNTQQENIYESLENLQKKIDQ